MRFMGLGHGPIEGGSGFAYKLGRFAAAFGLAGGTGEVGGAASAANGARLGEALTLEEAQSVFTASGELAPAEIASSRLIIDGSDLKNADLVKDLTSDGSNIGDWGKYTTRTIKSPSGDFQVHYYYNRKTGATYYGQDFKVIFNKPGGAE
jgi:hypothetical protein